MAEKKEVKGDIKEDTKEDTKEEKKPKKSFLKFIILGVIVIVLGAGGYLGWDLFKKRNQGETETSESSPQKKKKKMMEEAWIIFPLESFIVNLMDKAGAGRRYLKVQLELEIGDKTDETLLKKRIPQLRDTILLLLSSQTLSEINSMEGKLELKQALLASINRALGRRVVNRLYFTEFVVQ
jgi:flagellar FliL protein